MSPKIVKRQPVICYSRVTGWFSPLTAWGPGKLSEWADRKTFDIKKEDLK
jgi:hypothetical protein